MLLDKYNKSTIEYVDAKRDVELTDNEVDQYKQIAEHKATLMNESFMEIRNFLVDYCHSVMTKDDSTIIGEVFQEIESRVVNLVNLEM